MQISSLVSNGAQWWNGNLPNSHRFSLEMRLLVAQSTQPCGRSPKAAERSPTRGDSPSKVARDASKHGRFRGAHGRRARGSLQSISTLPFEDLGQGEHLATKSYELSPRKESKN